MSGLERSQEPAIEIAGLDCPGLRRAPFCNEVETLQASGVMPNVYLFAGPDCWARADDRRIRFGSGTALVLPDALPPSVLKWPAVDAVVVCWPPRVVNEYRRKVELGRALLRDGTRFVAIQHEPAWLSFWHEVGAGA